MPDQYGRPTINDWAGITQAFNGIQQNNQRNADRAEFKADQGQFRTALGGLSNTGQMPEDTRPDIAIQAKQAYWSGLQADKNISDIKQKQASDAKLNGLLTWRQQNPDKQWDDAPLDLYSGADGMAAYATAIDKEAQTEQGKSSIMKSRLARADVALKQFQTAKQYINNAMATGETQQAVNALEKLTDDLPMPYRIKGFDEQSQVLDVEYLDSHTGQFQKSGKVSLKEALQQVYNTGDKEFVGGIAQHMEAVRQGNLEYRQNPIRGTGQNGREYLIIPQKKPQDPSKVDIEVRDAQTNEKIMFDSWEALNNAGIYKEDLGRDKAVADIEKSKAGRTKELALAGKAQFDQQKAAEEQWVQVDEKGDPVMGQDGRPVYQTATESQVTAFMGANPDVRFRKAEELESANKFMKGSADAGSAQTDRYSKDLSFVLKPFAKPGADLSAMFANGDMSEPAKNALETAISFYEKNNGRESSLGKMDRMKFENAKKAIQLYNGMSQTVSNQYEQQTAMGGSKPTPANSKPRDPNAPPVEGARQAPDGKWYVEDPNRPGKYLLAE